MSAVEPYNLTATIMFLVEDLNQDGVMTVVELDAIFDKYDANGNNLYITVSVNIDYFHAI